MIIDGKKYGVKPFIVPLRDPKTFLTLHGVTIGDCGDKMVLIISLSLFFNYQ